MPWHSPCVCSRGHSAGVRWQPPKHFCSMENNQVNFSESNVNVVVWFCPRGDVEGHSHTPDELHLQLSKAQKIGGKFILYSY